MARSESSRHGADSSKGAAVFLPGRAPRSPTSGKPELANLYGLKAREIAQIVDDLISMAGVTPVDEVVWGRVLELWPNRFADFADGVLAAVASEKRYEAVATFDRKFVRRLRKEGLAAFWEDLRDLPALPTLVSLTW